MTAQNNIYAYTGVRALTYACTHACMYTPHPPPPQEKARGMPTYLYTCACMYAYMYAYIHTCTSATGNFSAT